MGCAGFGGPDLCPRCVGRLRPAPERVVAGSVVVRPALVHAGPARALVHALKYRGVLAAAAALGSAMAPLVPAGAVLVPIPRVGWRLLRHGVDPAVELAAAVARITGQPVARALSAPMWGRSRAGRRHGFAPCFRAVGADTVGPVVLVDDVVTTGTTIEVAAALFPQVMAAVTATASQGSNPKVTSLPIEGSPGLEGIGWK